MSEPSGASVSSPQPSAARAARVVSIMTLLSRFCGLARDYCLVAVFGSVAWITDAFLIAFTIPNLFRRLLGEGALSAAFIPVFVDTHENAEPGLSSRLASGVLTLLVLVTGGLAATGIVLALGANELLAPGEKLSLTLKLAAVMLPFLCFICCSALLSGMLQSLRAFALPAAMSIVLNLCFLGSFAYIYYVKQPAMQGGDAAYADAIFYVALAVVAAGLIQCLLQWPVLAARGIRLRPRLTLEDEGVRSVLCAMGPTALGLGVVQVNVLIDNMLAYSLSLRGAEGANTYLYLGNRLMQLPLGVFGIAVATTVFPFLASHAARDEHKALLQRICNAARMLLFIILPAGVGLAVTAAPLVQMIFQQSNLAFSDLAVYRTSAALACYAAGLAFFSMQHLLTRVFYARKEYSTPVKIAVGMVGVNLGLNLLLMHAPDLYRRWMGAAFYQKWLIDPDAFPMQGALGEAGLALATTLTAALNVFLLWNALKKRLQPAIGAETWEATVEKLFWSIVRIGIATILMGGIAALTVNSIPYEPEFFARLERGLLSVTVGVLMYYIACLVIPVPELEEFFKRFRRTR